MTDKPILFSGPMVRALLEGRKHMTRRVLSPQPPRWVDVMGFTKDTPKGHIWANGLDDDGAGGIEDRETFIRLPYDIGDRLWVREAWRTLHTNDCLAPRHLAEDRSKVTYEADKENRNPLWAFGKFRQGMHMPRWASRITLTVTGVRVERVQDISEDDAIAEGVEALDSPRAQGDICERDDTVCQTCGGTMLFTSFSCGGAHFDTDCTDCDTHVKRYRNLWDHINAHRPGFSWDANPWVSVTEFEVRKGNIDEMEG